MKIRLFAAAAMAALLTAPFSAAMASHGGSPIPVPNPLPAIGSMTVTPFSAPSVQFFALGSSVLTEAGRRAVAELVASGREAHATHYYVDGHADRSGSRASNGHLSYARAMAVTRELVRHGIDRSYIVIGAHGEAHPAVTTRDGVAHRMNRRTETKARGEYVWVAAPAPAAR